MLLKTIILSAVTGVTAAFAGAVSTGSSNAPEQQSDLVLPDGYIRLSTLPGFSGNVQEVPWYSNQCCNSRISQYRRM